MYHCENCERRFVFPLQEKEVHYECEEHPCEVYIVCPYCKSGEIKETGYGKILHCVRKETY